MNSKHIQVKWNDTRQSFLEGILSRGDRRLGPVIFNAFQRGAFLDAWGEHFSWEIWQKALEEEGVEPETLLQARSREHVFPWDFIRTGVDKDYLWSEYQKALTGRSTPDCRLGECQQCGVCPAFEVEPLIFNEFTLPAGGSFIVYPRESVKKFRLLLTKTGPSRFLGHLEWKEAVIRSFRRAKLPLAYSQGFHPLPRLSFGQALPVGLSSLGEWIDVQISDWMNAEQIKKQLPKELFPGTEILDISEVPLNSHLPQNQACQYQVKLDKMPTGEERLKEFLSSTDWLVEKSGKKAEILNLKRLIRELSLLPETNGTTTARWTLEPGPEGDVRPELVLRSIFNLPDSVIQGLNVVKSLRVSK